MARSKKTAKKKSVKKSASKKTTTKKSAPKKTSKRPRVIARVLSSQERAQLLKPRDNFEETTHRVLREWEEYSGLRVPGLTLGKLRSLLRAAEKAEEKELRVREKYERQLTPIADARRLAQHEAYKALLLTHKAVKLQASVDPGISERFSFLAEALTTYSGGAPSEPSEPVN
jgi:hypothetical protein